MGQLKNLAGNARCDKEILNELEFAGIHAVECGRTNQEVPYSYIGILHGFVFKRAWSYWMVSGPMPIKTANYIYEKYRDLSIRAGGDCGNVEPIRYAEPKDFRKYVDNLAEQLLSNYKLVDEIEKLLQEKKQSTKELYVNSYHIDTLEGLKVFADILVKRNIGKSL